MSKLVINHNSLYFDDGNIALLAPQSPDRYIAFRVHRSLLSKISPVFEGLFMLPPVDEAESYEGVPLVYMVDGADALESLFKLVYHDIDFPLKQLDPLTLCSLQHILTLTDKYAMNRLRQNIVGQVEQNWPLTLRQWDELGSRMLVITQLARGDLDNQLDLEPLSTGGRFPEPASAIRLARERNIPTILPAAFYHLSRLSIDDDWGETLRCDQPQAGSTAEWNLLTADDLRCLLKGQAKLRQAPRDILHFTYGTDGCPEDCLSAKRWELLVEIEETCIKSPDVLRVAREYIERKNYGDGICHHCSSRIRRDLATFRHILWDMLTDYFCI